ncbi:MAG: excinuclease ABC subunit UvrC, partial [Acidobacteriota bacterium]|nr:excinuclease ABC subunit UvrC [Acidobacteriota bacterium]
MGEPEPSAALRSVAARAPLEPGCYLFSDAAGVVLYVGKARSLRQRARSYFHESAQHAPKTEAMVAEARALEFIVTGNEIDALILENNLIKEHRPRYNVLLRDDKNFPYLKLSARDEFPRVVLVRRPKADGSLYYGPFLPASHARRTLRMIPRFFQVANCHLRFDGKQRPCLYYHLDQCLAPCAGKADPDEYRDRVGQVKLFLEGRNEELTEKIGEKMRVASDRQEFELAARYRDMIESLRRLSERTPMTSVGLEAIDFWAEHREGEQVALQLFRMREGRIIGRREFTFDRASTPDRFYDDVLPQFYAGEEPPAEVVLPRLPAEAELISTYLARRRGGSVKLRAPSRGERRRFL